MSNLTITAERREPAAFTGLRAGMTRDLALSSRPPDELNVPSRARSTTSSVTLDIDGVEVYAERREVQMLLWRVDVGGLLEGVSGRDYAERCMEVVRTYGRPRRLAGTSSSSLGQRFGDHDAHTVVLGGCRECLGSAGGVRRGGVGGCAPGRPIRTRR